MAKVYKCVTTCTWNGRYWEEGTLTHPIPADVTPPEHFTSVQDVEELQEVLNTIDEEEEPETFAALSQQIMDTGLTGTGILAGDDLQLKNFQQLKKIAKDMGVYEDTMKTKDELIQAIEAARE